MPDPQPTFDTQFDDEDEYRPEPEPEPLPPTWMDGSLRIGIHASIAGSYLNALESARKLGCNALQIFSSSPRMWEGGPARIPEVDAAAFRARRAELGLGPLVIHANYLINLAAAQPMLRVRSIQAFHDELVRAMALGADFLVVHPGSRGEATPEQAVSTVIESVKQGSKRVSLGNLRMLIENTAGMGVAVGSRLEEVAEILAGLKDVPVACLPRHRASLCGGLRHQKRSWADLHDRRNRQHYWPRASSGLPRQRFEDSARWPRRSPRKYRRRQNRR